MEHDEFGEIRDKEVSEAILEGEIIEEYSDDKPYPSYLILGKTNKGNPLHIVCAYDDNEKLIIIITVYCPNPKLWDNFKIRKKL